MQPSPCDRNASRVTAGAAWKSVRRGMGVAALALCTPVFAQEPAPHPLSGEERDALSSQLSSSASRYQPVSQETLRKTCQSAQCRHNVTIRLLKPDGRWYEQKSEWLPPMIQGGLVMLYPGEKVSLVPVFEAGKFREWQRAPVHAGAAAPVLTVHFRQIEGKSAMMAEISKNAGPAIKLSLGMFVLDGPDYPVKTSSCPLKSGKWFSTESWPHPIYSLLIGPPSQLAADAPLACD